MALPTPPSSTDPANFAARADAFLGALPDFQVEMNDLEASVEQMKEDTEAAVAAANAAGLADAAANATAANQARIDAQAAATTAQGQVTAATAQADRAENEADRAAQAAADAEAAAGVIPPTSGNNGKYLRVKADASGTEWAAAGGPRRMASRNSNTQIVVADSATLIPLTGTFTQTFAAASVLGPDFVVWLQNTGTGDITLDPNSSETIDGLASFVMYPGEVRLIGSTGSSLWSVVINAFKKTFIASGDFIAPPGYGSPGVCTLTGFLWGGGAGGTPSAGAGGGGAGLPFTLSLVPGTIYPVVVGASAPANTLGNASTFAGLTAPGGGHSLGGAAPGMPPGSYGGGGNGGANANGAGGDSYLGGGGGGGGTTGAGGKSVLGGQGGYGSSPYVPPTTPGGGGRSNAPGARGELRLWGVI